MCIAGGDTSTDYEASDASAGNRCSHNRCDRCGHYGGDKRPDYGGDKRPDYRGDNRSNIRPDHGRYSRANDRGHDGPRRSDRPR